MKLKTFIQNYESKIGEFETDYINNNLDAIKHDLQEFFSHINNTVMNLREYDNSDIFVRELTEKINNNIYENFYDKERDEIEKLYYQSRKYLLNKEIKREEQEINNIIARINLAKGV